MKRFVRGVLTLVLCFVLSLSSAVLRVPAAGAETSPIWPMFRYNVQHTGLCPYDTSSNSGTLKWKYQTGSSVYSSPAIAADGTI
jgi:hypothetical protein